MHSIEGTEIGREIHRIALLEIESSSIDPDRWLRFQASDDGSLLATGVGDQFPALEAFGRVDEGMGKIDAEHGLASSGHFKSRATHRTAEVQAAGDISR